MYLSAGSASRWMILSETVGSRIDLAVPGLLQREF